MTAVSALPLLLSSRVTEPTATFPFVSLPGPVGAPSIEVSLVAQLSPGVGTQLFHAMLARQRQHSRFVDELDEPSAKLGGSDFAKGDATALYSFSVGHGGHPFHRHAGHRVFTAISGSSGAQLRFSSATPAELEADPASFVRALRHVDVPPDCIFTVRFSGETWHQFAPLRLGTRHPAFFALSTHTNELGGQLSEALRQQVIENRANIPALTELLPPTVLALLTRSPVNAQQVPTTVLSLNDRPGGWMEVLCRRTRSVAGHLRAGWVNLFARPGFVSEVRPMQVVERDELASDSLLSQMLTDRKVHHQDRFTLTVAPAALGLASQDAGQWLADLLGHFLASRHGGVTRLMALRNLVVRPFKLRTSPLACPVSSLLSDTSPDVYAGRYPVLAQAVSPDRRTAQVVLGADDKHLVFRSCVEVRCLPDGGVEFSLATRVACRNLFGRVYMALIASTHRRYIAPRLMSVSIGSLLAARS
ncbi:MAG: DUF2867 domain-containing protein [Pseudomonadota bacterium]